MDWSESLYEEGIPEQYVERLKRVLLVFLILAAAVMWIFEGEHSGIYVSTDVPAGTTAELLSALKQEDTDYSAYSLIERKDKEDITAEKLEDTENLIIMSASVPSDEMPAAIVPKLDMNSVLTELHKPAVVLPVVPDISVDVPPIVSDDSADIEQTVPVVPSVPDMTIPDEILPDDSPAEDGTVQQDPSETIPIVPDSPADDGMTVPDASSDNTETVPPEAAPGTVGGFYVNDAGMITGIADPSVVEDGYLALPSEGCSGIASGAFLSAPAGIREMYIPANITYIEEGAFVGLTEMEWYEMAASGGYYTENGVLYSEGGTCILAFPPARTGTCNLPVRVTRFARDAFAASQLETLDAVGCNITDTGNLPEYIRLVTAI